VRFSPSPTGPFHVGGARTALFGWLFARNTGGVFLLRNEDTDPVRSSDHWMEGIMDGMRWLGLDWDGEIVRQSERRDAHLAAARQMLDEGKAYWCDCTADVIAARKGPSGGYDGFCRDRGLKAADDRVIRFRVDEGATTVRDVVRGDATFDHATIDDFVIVRRGGGAMFVLANVVDDEFQAITHVIRGEEHLPTTPKYLMLRRALGYGEDPVFAHLSLLVNERRQKLSKRRDKVAVLEFRDEGYTADAMRNYLALLGWSPPGDEEIVSLETLVREFRLENVTRAAAFFDIRKLQHFNGHYLREMTPDAFAAAARPWVEGDAVPWPDGAFDEGAFMALVPLVQTRVQLLSEVPQLVAFLFADLLEIDEKSWEKAIAGSDWSSEALADAAEAFAELPWEAERLKETVTGIGDRLGVSLRKVQAPIRVAVTGSTVGLPLFESLEILGRDATRARLHDALARLAALPRGA